MTRQEDAMWRSAKALEQIAKDLNQINKELKNLNMQIYLGNLKIYKDAIKKEDQNGRGTRELKKTDEGEQSAIKADSRRTSPDEDRR